MMDRIEAYRTRKPGAFVVYLCAIAAMLYVAVCAFAIGPAQRIVN